MKTESNKRRRRQFRSMFVHLLLSSCFGLLLVFILCTMAVLKDWPSGLYVGLVAMLAVVGVHLAAFHLLLRKKRAPVLQARPAARESAPTPGLARVAPPRLPDIQPTIQPPTADKVVQPAQRPQLPESTDAVVDHGLWQRLHKDLSNHRKEQGGLLLGYRHNSVNVFVAAVIPHQVETTPTFCHFAMEDLYRIREALDEITDTPGVEQLHTMYWVHTHPGLSCFLSGTDRSTLEKLRRIDPDTRAVVIDAFAQGFQNQFVAFDAKGQRVETAMHDCPIDAELGAAFASAVREVFRRNNEPEPQVFVACETLVEAS